MIASSSPVRSDAQGGGSRKMIAPGSRFVALCQAGTGGEVNFLPRAGQNMAHWHG
jgi:hypothetical protein